jgi:WhiA C-terminal HTH domain
MPYPDSMNEKRQQEASARDVAIAQQIIARPLLYQQLTIEQRRVLMKRVEMPGASWAEVGAAAGLSKSAAWSRWRRAIQVLPDGWDQPEGNSGNLWDMGQLHRAW